MSLVVLALWLLNTGAVRANGDEIYPISAGWTSTSGGYFMTEDFARDVLAGWQTDKADKETYKRGFEQAQTEAETLRAQLNAAIATYEEAQALERAAYKQELRRARSIGFGPFAGYGRASNGKWEACVGFGLVWKLF